jgi:GntR family transcriptional regulator
MDAVRVPKHYDVRDGIADLIAGAAPGTPVPTERELAARFGTSRTTVRQALASLTAEGRLERTQGRGTFVAEPKLVEVRQLTSYSDDLRRQGRTPTSEILSLDRVPADADTAAHLGLQPGQPVYRVERLRGVGGDPLAHECAHLVGRFPRLRDELERHGSLYRTLREVYGIELGRVEDRIRSALADPHQARLLGIDVGLPLLLVHRTGWDTDDRPVEYTRSAFRGDRFSFIAQAALPQADGDADA